MSRRPQILAGCLRLLACGPETTRDLSLHVGAPRALVAVALHGEPGVTREGDVWTLAPEAIAKSKQQEVTSQLDTARRPLPQRGGQRESKVITFLREFPGWHTYAAVADACELSYSAVVQSIGRYQTALKFSHDAQQRILVAWKDAAVTA